MYIIGHMPLASDPRGAHVSIIDMLNSLNIHFTGIHALGILFSLTFYEKRDQDEISTIILKFSLLMLSAPRLLFLGCVRSRRTIDVDPLRG